MLRAAYNPPFQVAYHFKEFSLCNRKEAFFKIFIRSGKIHNVEFNSGTSKSQVSKKSFYTFEDIDL